MTTPLNEHNSWVKGATPSSHRGDISREDLSALEARIDNVKEAAEDPLQYVAALPMRSVTIGQHRFQSTPPRGGTAHKTDMCSQKFLNLTAAPKSPNLGHHRS